MITRQLLDCSNCEVEHKPMVERSKRISLKLLFAVNPGIVASFPRTPPKLTIPLALNIGHLMPQAANIGASITFALFPVVPTMGIV